MSLTIDGEPMNSEIEAKREVRSEELFAGARTLLIHHDGSVYRLILTKQNKLILNK